jgi:hypothetical protein
MKKVWKILIAVILILVIAVAGFFAYTSTLSPEEKLSFDNNGLEVKVTYCQPKMKGRKIFGELIPYGKVWRTGANAATTISFSKPVTVAGEAVPAGEYTLWSIPNEGNWTIILNKEAGQWGTNYNENEDLLRVEVPAEEITSQVEQLTMKLASVDNGINVNLMWENTKVIIPVR